MFGFSTLTLLSFRSFGNHSFRRMTTSAHHPLLSQNSAHVVPHPAPSWPGWTTGTQASLCRPAGGRPSRSSTLTTARHGADLPQSACHPGVVSRHSPPVFTDSPLLTSCPHLQTHLLRSLLLTSTFTSVLTSQTHLPTHLLPSLPLTSRLPSHKLLGLWAPEEDGLCVSHRPLP